MTKAVTAEGDALSLRVHHRDLSAPHKLPGCLGTTVNLYYNLYINIQSTSSGEDCSPDDFISMGIILEEIVADVEEEYPSYKEEFIDTKVCPVPKASRENVTSTERANETTNGTRRALQTSEFHRRLGSYQYTSSGRCRACKSDDKDRRLWGSKIRGLAEIGAQKAPDAANEACAFADTAIFAASEALHGFESCDTLVTEVEKLAEDYIDADVAESYEQEVTAMKENCKSFEYTARKAAKEATSWCSLAENAGLVPGKENREEVERCAREADKLSKEAITAAKRIHAECDIMTEMKIELKRLILMHNFEMQKKELEELLAVEEENKNFMEDEMSAQIKLVEDQLLLTQDNAAKAELEAQRQMLLQMKKERMAAKALQTEKESQNMKKIYEEQLEHQIQEANILLEMQGGSGVSEWLRMFGDLLEHTAPGRLLERYNTTLKAGCLEEEPKVQVRIDEKESWAKTIKGKCQIPPKF